MCSLSLRQRESTFQKCSVEIVKNLDAVEITPVTGIVAKMGADTCGTTDPKEKLTSLYESELVLYITLRSMVLLNGLSSFALHGGREK